MRLSRFVLPCVVVLVVLHQEGRLNASTLQFNSRQTIATGFKQLKDLVTADFNGDGKPDLATIDSYDRRMVVYLNNGMGGFSASVSTPLTLGGTTGSLAVGDVNEDGKQDLIVGTISGGDQQILLLLGNGDGTFTQRGMLPGSYGSLQSLLVDVNNDKHLDLLSAANGSLYVYLGDGKGTFSLAPFANQGSADTHFAITAADFNRDGKMDFVASNYSAQNVAFYAGNGDGTFSSPVGFNPTQGAVINYLGAGDLNGDGRPDLFLSVPSTAYGLPGNGDGSFLTNQSQSFFFPSPAAPSNSIPNIAPPFALADMDQDGNADVILADQSTNTLNIDLNTDGRGDFPSGTPDFSMAIPAGSNHIQVADFNGDGLPDVAVSSNQTNEISIFLSIRVKKSPVVSLSSSSSAALVGTPVILTFEAVGTPAPTGTVTLNDGSSMIGTQTLDATGMATFSLPALSTGQHLISAAYSGDSRYTPVSTSTPFTQSITDVSLSLPVSTQTVASGADASYLVTLTPTTGFTGSAIVSCSGLPTGYSCLPITVSGGAFTSSSTLIVRAPVKTAYFMQSFPSQHSGLMLAALCFGVPLIRRRRQAASAAAFVFLGLATLSGCSGGATAAPRYTGTTSFTISATVTQGTSTVVHSTSATLVVQ